ncbi:hypothetical protein OTU49_004578 [Cherax quadricarinatus]|uniref:Thrombospondin/cartilage oligomeric matrix protein coiled-coil domain-containing protein n=1 Tax=Cherax quadricarinatus TaxID=27406 RepID=A0AAW0XA88_CHEQU
MKASAGGAVVLTTLVAVVSSAAIYDKGLTSSARVGLAEDTLVLSFQGVTPARRSGAPHHLLLSLAFPGHTRLALALDRAHAQVVLESVINGETVTQKVRAPPVKPRVVVRSLVVEINQGSALATIYVNCRLMGSIHLPKAPRDMAAQHDDDLRVYRERNVEASVDWNISVMELLEKLGCPADGDTNEFMAQANEVYTYRRAVRCQNLQYGEPCPTFTQPITPPDRGNKLVKTLAELIETIKDLQIEIQTQREETALLRDALLNCEACKPGRLGSHSGR